MDLQRVGVELEARLTCRRGELERRAHGLGVRVQRQVGRLGGRAVGDRAGDRLAGQELDAAGGEEDAAAEVDLGRRAEGDAEVLDADPQVVELEDRAERDLLRRRGLPGGRLPGL